LQLNLNITYGRYAVKLISSDYICILISKRYVMKIVNILKALFFCLSICFLVSCKEDKNQFSVEGTIKDADNKTLYLENIGTSSIILLDSVKLKGDFSFKFKQPRPTTPDFYRLRLENQIINFVIDSTETIIINGDASNFAKNYVVEGNVKNEKIKELTLLQLNTSIEYNQLKKQYDASEISTDEYVEQVTQTVAKYKTVALQYIYAEPLSSVSYFALFQQINNLLIFDLYDKTDSKAYGAVATAWNQYYPDSPRAKQLYSLFAGSLVSFRNNRPLEIVEGDTKELFDIVLPAIDGKEVKLSDIGDGKLTLIDFTAYGMSGSPLHNIRLAEIYEKYKSKGFEIYQVSLDPDEHFWKNTSVNLPWITVRDPQSIQSDILRKYNVSELPASFIRDGNGEIVARIESYNNLEKDIVKYLK